MAVPGEVAQDVTDQLDRGRHHLGPELRPGGPAGPRGRQPAQGRRRDRAADPVVLRAAPRRRGVGPPRHRPPPPRPGQRRRGPPWRLIPSPSSSRWRAGRCSASAAAPWPPASSPPPRCRRGGDRDRPRPRPRAARPRVDSGHLGRAVVARGDVAGAHPRPWLVVAATGVAAVDAAVAAEADVLGVWCVRAAGHGSAALPAVVRDGPVVAALTTGAPALTAAAARPRRRRRSPGPDPPPPLLADLRADPTSAPPSPRSIRPLAAPGGLPPSLPCCRNCRRRRTAFGPCSPAGPRTLTGGASRQYPPGGTAASHLARIARPASRQYATRRYCCEPPQPGGAIGSAGDGDRPALCD